MAATAGTALSPPSVASSDLVGPCSCSNSAQVPCFSAPSPSSASKPSNRFSFNFIKNTSLFSKLSFRKGRNGYRSGVPKLSPPLINSSIPPRNQEFVRAASSNDNGTPAELPLIVCFGEMLIDFVPTVGGVSLAEAPAFKKAPGGAPANVAVGIARLGGRSAFIGKVGDDEFGYMLANILKENNVEDGGILFDKGARTALAFVTLRSDGEREFMFFRNPSADMLLQENELNVSLIQKATIFHYGSISLITEPCKTAHLAAMKIAKEEGAILSYDPNLRLPLWPSAQAAREGILSIWDEADIIKISEEEITFLTDGGDPYSDEAARKLMHPKLKLLLVTEGQDGCRYYTKEFSGRVGGMKVDTIDTTGAGDAFVAGSLTQIAQDLSILQDEKKMREILQFANACGAIATTERGAIPALPDREAVLKVVSKVPA